jgi:hypothetical protein
MVSWEECCSLLCVLFSSFRAGKGLYNFALAATVGIEYIDEIEAPGL